MLRSVLLASLAGALGALPSAADDEVVFRSDVSLARVDAQVLDGTNRAIRRLNAEDFVLRVDGRAVPIRNFASEDMPVDVLFLLDVSASMRPHVQRIADASGQALSVLGQDDRMAIMVFDRYTRVRLPFSSSREEVRREFDRLLRQEGFNGGTDITRAMLDAAAYLGRQGRPEARRAIVILTDDQTELNRDEQAVGRALARADAVLCALLAPDAMAWGRYPGGGGRRRGTWGSGGGIGGGIPGVILGPRSGGPYGGSRYPGGGRLGPHTQSAGSAQIARDSGGDSMSVNDASALEETLARLRQRYTLYFSLPEGARPGDESNMELDLASAARRRYSDAEVRYRRVHLAPGSGDGSTSVRVTRASPAGASPVPGPAASPDPSGARRRRVAVNEDGTAISPPATEDGTSPAPLQPAPSAGAPSGNTPPSPSGSWRKVDPTRKPQ